MKKHLSFGTLLLTLFSLAACQGAPAASSSSESNHVDSSSIAPSSSAISSFSQPNNSSSSQKSEYYPVGPTTITNLLSDEMTFSLDTKTIDKDKAEELINNDISQYPEEKSLHKKTSIMSTRRESHVTVNRSTATYSVKDLIEEKHTISQIDSDNKWYYTKSVEETTTTYFVEDTLYRHVIHERLYFVKDGYLYEVFANKNYYEGFEDRGTFEAYYYKRETTSEEETITNMFALHLESYVYFSQPTGLNKLDKTLYTNFTQSSSFYYSGNYKSMERHPNYEFHSSGERGDFGCIVADDYDYHFSDLNDYPSDEKGVLNTISYHQDYLVNISNYFTFNEDYYTKSVSKKADGTVIRDETMKSRKKIIEECETFYPDLSKFEEREYNNITK